MEWSEDASEFVGDRDVFTDASVSSDEDKQGAGMSQMEAMMSVMTVIIGSGIMALPLVPLEGGYVLSTLGMLLSAWISLKSGLAMHKAYMASAGGGKSDRLEAYEQYMSEAAGKPGEWVTRVFMCTLFTGVLAAYVMLMSSELVHLFDNKLGEATWQFILIALLCVLSLIRDISVVAKATPISTAAAVASCILICFKSTMDARVWQDWPKEYRDKIHQKWPESFMALGTMMAVLFGSFAAVPNVPSIIAVMRDPRQFEGAYKAALAICLSLYFCIMLLGHYSYGTFIQENIVLSMQKSPANAEEAFGGVPYSRWTGDSSEMFGNIMGWLVVTNLIISCPLLMQALFSSYMSLSPERCRRGSNTNRMMRILALAAVTVIVLIVPSFMNCFGLFMAICTPVICVILPLYSSVKIRRAFNAPEPSLSTKVQYGVMIAVAVFVLVVGVGNSAGDLFGSDDAHNKTTTLSRKFLPTDR